MKIASRHTLLAAALVVGAVACSESSAPVTRMAAPTGAASVLFNKIKATDSTMTLTDITYNDTTLVLKRLVPLDSNISVSMIIGPQGGEIKINAAGGKIDFPAGALSAPTLITMTAYAGDNVAYDFQPHGITFAQPVKIQQTIAGTWAAKYPTVLNGVHGSYYARSLDSAWVDPGHFLAKIDESEIGYPDASVNASQIKFFIGHFSGYMVSCGRAGDGQ